ncbi:hypothetical protein ACLOJK_005334 [Asimina triloba]
MQEEYLKKMKHLVKVELAEQGPTALGEEEECLARQEEADLQAGLTLYREEACRSGLIVASLEASAELAPLGPVSSSVLVMDVKANITSPVPAFEREPSEAPGRKGTEVRTIEEKGPSSYCGANPEEAEALVGLRVLGSIFGEASTCPMDDQLFHWPFDMEARALKILGDLIPVRPRAIREYNALGFAPSLDNEERGADERMLQKFLLDVWQKLSELEERIRLIDRPNVNIPSEWEFLEEALVKALSIAKERLEVKLERCRVEGIAKGERHFFFQLLEMGRRANRTTTKVGNLRLQKFSAQTSIRYLFDQVPHAQKETSRLLSEISAKRAEQEKAIDNAAASRESEAKALRAHGANPDTNGETSRAELEAVRGEVSVLQELVALLGSGEAELLVESETTRAKVAQLRTKLETSRVDLEYLQAALSQGGTYVSIIAKYLRSDIQGVERSKNAPTTPEGSPMGSQLAIIDC